MQHVRLALGVRAPDELVVVEVEAILFDLVPAVGNQDRLDVILFNTKAHGREVRFSASRRESSATSEDGAASRPTALRAYFDAADCVQR